MLKRCRHYLLMGFIVLLPTLATIYILKVAFIFIDRILGSFLTTALEGVLAVFGILEEPDHIRLLGWTFEERIPGIGFIFMLIILMGVGYATKSAKGKRAMRRTEQTIKKIPVAKTIYSTVEQITTAFIQDRTSFKEVVLVEYPRRGLFTLGFLTGEAQGEVDEKTSQTSVNVFLPTTPNPTSGYLVVVSKSEVIYLDMSVEQGLKYIISGGVITPRTSEEPMLLNMKRKEDRP